jgi:rSAM/selenodomain-associated transferase 1
VTEGVPIPVLVFAKAPDPGTVKTRLAPALGNGGAAVLAARFALRTLETANRAAVGPVVLMCAPDPAQPFFEVCRRRCGVELEPQGTGDLGERMHRAFATYLATAAGAIVVGTDTPDLSAADLVDAADTLRDGIDAVIGPAGDGGYWLLGLRRPAAALFRSMPWSTGDVLRLTRERVAALGWRMHALAERADIDRPEDVHAMLRRPDLAPLVADLVARHAQGSAP